MNQGVLAFKGFALLSPMNLKAVVGRGGVLRRFCICSEDTAKSPLRKESSALILIHWFNIHFGFVK